MIPARFALVARFFSALAISLWLGGMGFFGAVAAPALFKTARARGVPEIAPEIVGVMLSRFSVLTYVCAFLLVVGWFVDGLLSLDRRLSWKLQGVGSVLALGLAIYLGRVLLPQTIAQQNTILPIFARAERGTKLSPQEQAQREQFDAGHKAYQQVAVFNVWLLVGVLALLMARSGFGTMAENPTFAAREQSPQT